jgi:hypothetical protein
MQQKKLNRERIFFEKNFLSLKVFFADGFD